jgi:hypothetical protein
MPSQAKAYMAMIAALASAVLVVVISRWNPENLVHFVLFFALAMVASAMKIRLPGFKTTISINFVFILIGLALFCYYSSRSIQREYPVASIPAHKEIPRRNFPNSSQGPRFL